MSEAVRRRLVIGAAGLVAVIALAIFGLARDHAHANGRFAPGLPSETLLGPRTTVASLLAGAHRRPALVVFWASWCGPCAREAPALERFAQSHAGHGRIVAVDWNDELSEARAFVRHYRWTFPTLRDAEGSVGSAYGLTGLPTTFVINARGQIAGTLRGPQTESSLAQALAGAEHS